MTLGLTPSQGDLFRSTTGFCEPRIGADSIYGLLHRECDRLFPDAMFADLFTDVGRRSVPPMIVAVVMVLQRIEGCSDREAVDRFAFDARWKYAAGGLDFDYPGFVHTVLVDMRARLAASAEPDRIFQAVLTVCKQAGLVGPKRVLDSTPLYDAVTTMDTVTLIRSAIRGLLKVAGAGLAVLVDGLARDGMAALGVLDGLQVPDAVGQAAQLLATVLGQDLDRDEGGVFRIARRVAKDRVISTVDTQARHGHKTAARGFDGYKGHLGIDPDSEIITATTVTAGNVGDADAAQDLIGDLLGDHGDADRVDVAGPGHEQHSDDQDGSGTHQDRAAGQVNDSDGDGLAVYGDNAYGTGPIHDRLERAGIGDKCKTQQPSNTGGRWSKDAFEVDLDTEQVACPAGQIAPIRRGKTGAGTASFGPACAHCPLRAQCTTAASGRTISIGVFERALTNARQRQQDPGWVGDYRATRPKVERKIGHLMRRTHGGRRARVRGRTKVAADFALLAAAVNLARLSVLAVASTTGQGWATTTG